MKRKIYYISDGTGITAEALGHSLISQFENIAFESVTIPYVDSLYKAKKVVQQINAIYQHEGQRPLLFTTLVNPEIREYFSNCQGMFLDLFQAFLKPIEAELQAKSSYTVGRSHGVVNSDFYSARIDAVNYALASDDGLGTKHYDEADIIIVGVSRSGKTPTSLYLALQFGIFAANYPLTEEDLENFDLPKSLSKYKKKLFGLTIDPARLQQIRNERRPDSRYASIEQCEHEIQTIEKLYRHEKIAFLNTTTHSIEEISTRIIEKAKLTRRVG